jgi:hypothetical protein
VPSDPKKKKKKSILKISYFFWQFCLVSEEGVKTMGIVSEEAIDEFQELMDQGLTFSSYLFLCFYFEISN